MNKVLVEMIERKRDLHDDRYSWVSAIDEYNANPEIARQFSVLRKRVHPISNKENIASDLLEALKEASHYFYEGHSYDHPTCIRIREAIAKAEILL